MTNGIDESTYRGSVHRGTSALHAWHALKTNEPAIEPLLPIIDAHHHLYDNVSDLHHYRLEELHRDFGGGHNIAATVYVEGYGSGWYSDGPEHLKSVGEIKMIVDASRMSPWNSHAKCRLAAGIVSHVDLTLGARVEKVLEAHIGAGDGRLRGVRHRAVCDEGLVGRFISNPPKQHILLDNSFKKGFSLLHQFGLSFDAWLYHHQLPELIDLADTFAHIPIVINHVGGLIGIGEYRSEPAANFARWRCDMRTLAVRPNVYVKIGGMGMPAFGFGFEHLKAPPTSSQLAEAWKPLIDVCVEAFGPNRCMFESNFPVDKQSCGYTELWNAFKIATIDLSPGDRNAMFYETARRFYGLPVTA